MFGVNLILNDTRNLKNNISNLSDSTKANDRGFSKILENKKFIENKKETISLEDKIGKETKIKDENKVSIAEKEEKLMEEDNYSKTQNIAEELIVLINLITDLIVDFHEIGDGDDKLDLESLKLELDKALTLIEDILENKPSIDHEEILEIFDNLEGLIPSFDKELVNNRDMIMDDLVETGQEKILDKLKNINDSIRGFADDKTLSFEAKELIIEDEYNPLSLYNEDNREIEQGEIKNKDKNITNIKELYEHGENLEIDEEIEIKNMDFNSSNFEIVDRKTTDDLRMVDKELDNLGSKEVIEQITNEAKLIIHNDKQEIKIKLKPEILGDLMLKMEIEKGALIAKLMVDNYKTKELIEANLYQLKQDMEENGLEIKAFEVFVGTNEDFERHNRQGFNFNNKSKKLSIKDKKFKEVEIYNNSIIEKTSTTYQEGKLNLFA